MSVRVSLYESQQAVCVCVCVCVLVCLCLTVCMVGLIVMM